MPRGLNYKARVFPSAERGTLERRISGACIITRMCTLDVQINPLLLRKVRNLFTNKSREILQLAKQKVGGLESIKLIKQGINLYI